MSADSEAVGFRNPWIGEGVEFVRAALAGGATSCSMGEDHMKAIVSEVTTLSTKLAAAEAELREANDRAGHHLRSRTLQSAQLARYERLEAAARRFVPSRRFPAVALAKETLDLIEALAALEETP